MNFDIEKALKLLDYPWEIQVRKIKGKSLSLSLYPQGLIVLKVPKFVSFKEANDYLNQKEKWIYNHCRKFDGQRQIAMEAGILTPEEIEELKTEAKVYFKERVEYYAPIVGVDYNRITIRAQGTRWGSCSSKGNLNFNCLLMLAPPEVRDSVVVHELCHRLEMNHSKNYYKEVYRVFPDYDKCHKWLKDNGKTLMLRKA